MATLVNPNPNPVNLDRQILKLQNLFDGITWLEYVYGRAWKAYRLSERADTMVYPNVYTGNGEYRSMMPDDRIKSYCFFIPRDGLRAYQYVAIPKTSKNSFKETLDIVFYFNFKKIDPTVDFAFTENLIQDVLQELRRANNYSVENIYYETKNVFDGYSVNFVQAQYLSYPFGGFRISGALTFDEDLKDC